MNGNGISEQEYRLVEKLQAFNDRLQFLHHISQKISEIKPLPELLHEIMETSKMLMKAEASSLLLYDTDDEKLHFYVATGEKGEMFQEFSMELGEGIAGWVAEHREPLLIEDCYQDSRFNPEYDKKMDFVTRSMICVPLVHNERLIGVMQVINKKDSRVFDPDDLALFQTLAAQCAVAIDNHFMTQKMIRIETLERELEVAREIQQNILPKAIPQYPDLEIGTRLIPAHQVGGDYFNIIRISEKKSLFVVADVAGKGIPAALIVSTLDACLNSYLKFRPDRFDMLELVGTMNRVLIDTTTSTKFVTAWFGLYDHATGRWTIVNAGHMPPIFWCHEDGEVSVLQEGGIVMGSLDVCYECHEMVMKENDVLVYYTDGVTEAWNVHDEDYGDERLMQVISRYQHASAKEILTAIAHDVRQHVGDAAQSDDITCVVIKKK